MREVYKVYMLKCLVNNCPEFILNLRKLLQCPMCNLSINKCTSLVIALMQRKALMEDKMLHVHVSYKLKELVTLIDIKHVILCLTEIKPLIGPLSAILQRKTLCHSCR